VVVIASGDAQVAPSEIAVTDSLVARVVDRYAMDVGNVPSSAQRVTASVVGSTTDLASIT
jgi:hypothetical protein